MLGEQFLYKNKPTVQEMYQRSFQMGDTQITLEIEDTSGFFAYDFPAMVGVSLRSADAVLIVFSVTDKESWDSLGQLRDIVMEYGRPDIPMVMAGNKAEEEKRVVTRAAVEELVEGDWDDVYVECSAKTGENVSEVFRRLISLASLTSLDTDFQLVSVAEKGEKCKNAKRRSFAISASLSKSLTSPSRYFRRKSKSLQFEPEAFSELVEKSSHNGSRRVSNVPDFGKLLIALKTKD